MSLKESRKIPNGDGFTNIDIFSCDRCGCEFNDSNPHTKIIDGRHLCIDCSFVEQQVTEKEFLELSGIMVSNAHAIVKDEKPILWIGKAPWEKSAQDIRNSSEYSKWRTDVFERDGYKCQHCDQVGGTLNAHHIKPFAQYEDLRLELTNGLTLCEDCHKAVHRKR